MFLATEIYTYVLIVIITRARNMWMNMHETSTINYMRLLLLEFYVCKKPNTHDISPSLSVPIKIVVPTPSITYVAKCSHRHGEHLAGGKVDRFAASEHQKD